MHHTSISIVILGKHIATMLRHNPYSLLRSTARTNLVERSYSQFFFIYYYIIFFNNFFCSVCSVSTIVGYVVTLTLAFLLHKRVPAAKTAGRLQTEVLAQNHGKCPVQPISCPSCLGCRKAAQDSSELQTQNPAEE